MAYRFSSPNTQFMGSNGVPLAGGSLYFYQSGTSTPATTYSDSALTIPNANPIVLNASGYAGSIFLSPGQQYKVVLNDVNGVQQWTEDPVSDPTASGQSFSSFVAINGTAGTTRALYLQSSGSTRWAIEADTTAESGANAGSNFALVSYTDAGAILQTIMTVNRATGAVSFPLGLAQPTTQKFLTGSGTYTTPAGVVRIRVRMVAGGGGGGGWGSAGGGVGGTGGSSSFGSFTTIGGAGGGTNSTFNPTDGGAGGSGGAGSAFIRLPGASGSSASGQWAGSGGIGAPGELAGCGGASPFGGAGMASISNLAANINAKSNSGSGGAGAASAAIGYASGSGGGAGEYAEFTINNPIASYAYAVGAAGAAGTAGTSGVAGGAGAAGAIYVEEFYY